MTNQQMFDKAVRGLRAQGFQRSMQGTRCCYHSSDGKKCAWGHVDPEGTPQLLDGIHALYKDKVGVAGQLMRDQVDFAVDLQEAHDEGLSSVLMEENLRALATQYNLTFPEAQ